MDNNRLRRSLLFVPADRPDRIEKAATKPVDVIVVELEDGVAPDHKTMARKNAGEAIAHIDFGHREVALRPNRISTLNGIEDISAMASWPRKPDLILLPKVESAGEVKLYDELLTEMGAASQLLLLVETSLGLKNANEMVLASNRVTAISFAIADLPAELGCQPYWEPMLMIRSSIITAAALAGVMPIDPPFLNIKDNEGLAAECRRIKDMGYTGKICIHPSQLDSVNQAFSPTKKEVSRARKIVEAAGENAGAVIVDGRMVDAPVVKIAQRVLAYAQMFDQG